MSTVLNHRSAAGLVALAALIAAGVGCSSDSQTTDDNTGAATPTPTAGSGGTDMGGGGAPPATTDPTAGAAGADTIDNVEPGEEPPIRPTDCTLASDFDCICSGPEADRDPRCGPGNRVGPGPNTDANCNTTNSSSGNACTIDCVGPCGFDQLGIELCTCVGGVYDDCNCPTPMAFEGALTAPSCSTIPLPAGALSGAEIPLCATLPANLIDECIEILEPDAGPIACETVWQVCAGTDPGALGNPNRGCVCLPQIDPVALTFFDPPVLEWDCGSTNGWFTREFVAP